MRPVTEITFVGDEDVTFISTHQQTGTIKRRIMATNVFYNVSPLPPAPSCFHILEKERERDVYLTYIQLKKNVIT